MDYHEKYLKYKAKYLDLKDKLEGGVVNDVTQEECKKHDKLYCSTSAIGCHWNEQYTNKYGNIIETGCVKNICKTDNNNKLRTKFDCSITTGCEWGRGYIYDYKDNYGTRNWLYGDICVKKKEKK